MIETFPGKDGRIRTVNVLKKKGMINRMVQKLQLLEKHKEQATNERFCETETAVQTVGRDSERQNKSHDDPRDVNDRPSLVGEDVQAFTYMGASRDKLGSPGDCRIVNEIYTISLQCFMRVNFLVDDQMYEL